MSDQCKYCTDRGDIKMCMATECGHHESWYALELEAQLATATKERDTAIKEIGVWSRKCGLLESVLDRAKEQTMDNQTGERRSCEKLSEQLTEYKRAFTIAVNLGRGLKSKVCTTCPVENCNRDSAGCKDHILAYVKRQTK